MWRHLNNNKILSEQQYGFKKGCSTEHLLVDLLDKIFKSKNAGNYLVSIFINIRKAFDCVDHEILLAKLTHYGLPVHWFADYLKDGEQIVYVGNNKSKKVKINICVRQGSIRGHFQPKVSPSPSSLITPDIFKLLGPYESSVYPLEMGVW